jgi:hypothetical protein
MRCVFSRGVPPPDTTIEPDSVRARRRVCLARGPFTTFVFGRAASTDASPAGPVRIRVVRLTASSFEVWDLDLRRGVGGFEVIGTRRLGGVAS